MNEINSRHRFSSVSVVRPLGIAVAILVCALAAPNLVGAAEIRLILDNDFLTTNPIDDDLYTSGIRLGYSFGRYDLGFVENAFTDSLNDLRFDETYLRVGRLLDPVGCEKGAKGWAMPSREQYRPTFGTLRRSKLQAT